MATSVLAPATPPQKGPLSIPFSTRCELPGTLTKLRLSALVQRASTRGRICFPAFLCPPPTAFAKGGFPKALSPLSTLAFGCSSRCHFISPPSPPLSRPKKRADRNSSTAFPKGQPTRAPSPPCLLPAPNPTQRGAVCTATAWLWGEGQRASPRCTPLPCVVCVQAMQNILKQRASGFVARYPPLSLGTSKKSALFCLVACCFLALLLCCFAPPPPRDLPRAANSFSTAFRPPL